jgi:hypothetical protein
LDTKTGACADTLPQSTTNRWFRPIPKVRVNFAVAVDCTIGGYHIARTLTLSQIIIRYIFQVQIALRSSFQKKKIVETAKQSPETALGLRPRLLHDHFQDEHDLVEGVEEPIGSSCEGFAPG